MTDVFGNCSKVDVWKVKKVIISVKFLLLIHFCSAVTMNVNQSMPITDRSSTEQIRLSVVIPSTESYEDINVGPGYINPICNGCKTGVNGLQCSGDAHGDCGCINLKSSCKCKPAWSGDACQYKLSKITCENMRNCILCQVHSVGPLVEENDCYNMCYHNYPTPLVVKTLYFQEDEHLCSFIYYPENSTSSRDRTRAHECRYFFKYGPISSNGNIKSSKLYVVAQQDMSCGKPAKFPLLRPISRDNSSFKVFQEKYNEIVRASDVYDPGENFERKQNIFVVTIIFFLILLPIVTCTFSFFSNVTNLPCGLCNILRQPSSRYIRNVQPYPGILEWGTIVDTIQPT